MVIIKKTTQYTERGILIEGVGLCWEKVLRDWKTGTDTAEWSLSSTTNTQASKQAAPTKAEQLEECSQFLKKRDLQGFYS